MKKSEKKEKNKNKEIEIQDQTDKKEKSAENQSATEEKKEEQEIVEKETAAEKKTNSKEEKSEESIEEKYEKLNDKYLRLAAEYDNYRRRTLKEKMELIKTAGEDILLNLLPVIDNMERAEKSIKESSDLESVKEGIGLIHKGLVDFMGTRGVKEVKAIGEKFDADLYEAVTKIPAPEKDQKGKVIDVIEKGYKLNDKIIRYAKVVVGE